MVEEEYELRGENESLVLLLENDVENSETSTANLTRHRCLPVEMYRRESNRDVTVRSADVVQLTCVCMYVARRENDQFLWVFVRVAAFRRQVVRPQRKADSPRKRRFFIHSSLSLTHP